MPSSTPSTRLLPSTMSSSRWNRFVDSSTPGYDYYTNSRLQSQDVLLFNDYGATLGVLGAEAALLFLISLACCRIREDPAKPYIVCVSLALAGVTASKIINFVLYETRDSSSTWLYVVSVKGIFENAASVSFLLGGFVFLLSVGNIARTRQHCGSTGGWFSHILILAAGFALAVAAAFFSYELQLIPLAVLRGVAFFGSVAIAMAAVMSVCMGMCGSPAEADLPGQVDRVVAEGRSRLCQSILFFLFPLAITIPDAVNAGSFMYSYIVRFSSGYGPFNAADLAAKYSTVMVMGCDVYSLFSLCFLASAVIILPSFRQSLSCQSRTLKIAPVEAFAAPASATASHSTAMAAPLSYTSTAPAPAPSSPFYLPPIPPPAVHYPAIAIPTPGHALHYPGGYGIQMPHPQAAPFPVYTS